MMAMLELSLERTDQVFSYYDDHDAAKLLHMNVTLLERMRKQVPKAFKRITMTLTQAEYDLCMQHRGIEEPKVAALRGRDLRAPGHLIMLTPSTYKIVDGHHRLVRRFRGGIRTMDFWASVPDVWRHALMTVEDPRDLEMIKATLPPRVGDDSTVETRVEPAHERT